MILTHLDWLVIVAYFAVNLAIGFFYMKRASGDIGEFFLSGRSVSCCLALTLAYNAISGLWAVLWTDLLQFILKMSMVCLLAYFAVHAIGGMGSLAAQVHAFDAAHLVNGQQRDTLAFIPSSASPFFLSFLVLLSLNWWASWYPGAEPGGGGYIAQRIFSAKNEKHSLGATLWFNIAHYAL